MDRKIMFEKLSVLESRKQRVEIEKIRLAQHEEDLDSYLDTLNSEITSLRVKINKGAKSVA